MSLNVNVEEGLKEAEGHLRNSLYWASKNEKPYVCVLISKMISEIDSLIQIDKFSDKLEEKMKKNGNDMFGGFF